MLFRSHYKNPGWYAHPPAPWPTNTKANGKNPFANPLNQALNSAKKPQPNLALKYKFKNPKALTTTDPSNAMKKTLPAFLLLSSLFFLPPVAWAQATDTPSPSSNAQAAMTLGEIRKVDKDNAKLTIKHDTIVHLSMPPMTMVFLVKDKSLLDAVKPGDKVRFMVVQEAGKMIVTEIAPSP